MLIGKIHVNFLCSSSIKRSSIHEKNELSHTDTKAEGAALLIQLQNTVSTTVFEI